MPQELQKSLLVALCVVWLKVAGVLGWTLVFLLLLLLLALAATAAAAAAALLLLLDELLPQLLDEAAIVGVYNLHPLILNTINMNYN
jgi:hypothetical protein